MPVLGVSRWPAGRVGRLPVSQQPLIPGVQPGPYLVVDPAGTGGAGPVGGQFGIHEQLGHARRPALPGLLGDRLQLAQQVGAAQRMADVLKAPVRRQPSWTATPANPGSTPA